MIPIDINYTAEFVRDFEKSVDGFVNFLERYSNEDNASKQILILSTDEYYNYMENIKAFSNEVVEAFSNTCAYCNSRNISAVLPIHPIEKNRDFPRLAAEIRNLLPFCSSCKRLVGIFEYERPDLDIYDFEELIFKRPNILIPIQEASHLSLKLGNDGIILGTDKNSRRTIKYSGINREEQIDERSKLIEKKQLFVQKEFQNNSYERLWQVLKFNRQDFFSHDHSFAKSLEDLNELRESQHIGIEQSSWYKSYDQKRPIILRDPVTRYNGYMSVELNSFTFESLRTLGKGHVDLNGIKCLGIVGENGVGKSTLLNFISFCTRGTRLKELKDASDGFIGSDAKVVKGSLIGSRNGFEFINFVVSGRLDEDTSRVQSEIREKIRMAYIGESRILKDLVGRAEKWLSKLNESDFDIVASQLKQIYGIEYDSALERDDSDVVLIRSEDGVTKPLSTWSSGYKSILSIVYSIYQQFGPSYRLQEEFVHLDSIVGIVFIEEIELHLHPNWKMSLVSNLKRIFPDILFVFTTHDPLVLKGCAEKEILLVKRTAPNQLELFQDLPDISRSDTDQILTSRFFGLGSTSNIEDNLDLVDFYHAIQTGDKKDISSRIPGLQKNGLFGRTYRETIAFMCVDKSLAEGREIDIDEVIAIINQKVDSFDKD